MELLEIVLLLIAVVLASAVLDQLLTRVSLPLVQMGMGVVIMLAAGGSLDVQIESELFLVLFIAPLLFDESRRVSKRQLMANLPSVLSLAIGLVLATVLVVGFLLHWLVPSIPLAAAFALGAALGPTDAVAVSALSGSVKLKTRQKALLSGEALINDASGIVSFQFAVAAATTGVFSVVDASQSFAFLFFGGLGIGLVIGAVALLVMRFVRSIGLDGTTFHVTFEVVVPFAAFLLAEEMGASGILSVVAAGLLMTLLPKERSTSQARVSVVSSGVWEMLSFVLNGVVFVLLGMQLPQAFLPSWNGVLPPETLVGIVVAVTVAVMLVRFVWVLALDLLDRRSRMQRTGSRRDAAADLGGGRDGQDAPASLREVARDALVTTLAGPKGAVTLSIVFTLPTFVAGGAAFPFRSELIFVASGVIVLTLVVANFVVPPLAPADEAAEEDERRLDAVRVQVLSGSVGMLHERFMAGDALAGFVLRGYQGRLAEASEALGGDSAKRHAVAAELSQGMLARQREALSALAASGNVSEEASRVCEHMLERTVGRTAAGDRTYSVRDLVRIMRHRKASRTGTSLVDEAELRVVSDELERVACDYLDEEAKSRDPVRAEMAALWLEHRRSGGIGAEAGRSGGYAAGASRLCSAGAADASGAAGTADAGGAANVAGDPSDPGTFPTCVATPSDVHDHVRELEEEALQAELEAITDLREQGEITRAQATALRNEVYVLQMSLAEEG